jgi:hypothetical protein
LEAVAPAVVALTLVAVTVPPAEVVPWMTTESPGWIASARVPALREIFELLVVVTFTVLPSAPVT